jgi:hypothetical protein
VAFSDAFPELFDTIRLEYSWDNYIPGDPFECWFDMKMFKLGDGSFYPSYNSTRVNLMNYLGVWMVQVSGGFNTAYNTFGIRRAGANVEVIVNGNVILTAAGTVPANGSVGLMLVPGTDTSTTFIDYIRFF